MSGDPERPAHSATYEGRTLLAALGRKPSSLATQAEFPSEMLSRTRHLASAKRGRRRWWEVEAGGWVEERGEGWMKEERESEEEAELNGRTMAECTRVHVAGRFTLSVTQYCLFHFY